MKTRISFLLTAIVLATFIPVSPSVKAESLDLPYSLVADTRTIMALTAAENAAAVFNGEPYDWELNNSCSSYSGEYFRQLGFPMGPGGKSNWKGVAVSPLAPDPFPAVGTVKQASYIKKMYPKFAFEAPVADFLTGKLWGKIKPGSAVYLETAVSHNGYNTYYHVAILLGYNSTGKPVFADLAVGMKKGPEIGRTLEQLAKMYKRNRWGEWDLEPYPVGARTPKLNVFVFDAIGASRTLWQEGGRVWPISPKIKEELGADVVFTVNINDGTAALFEYYPDWGMWGGVAGFSNLHTDYWTVVGRFLNAHPPLSLSYRQDGQRVSGLPSFYDGEYGVLYERGIMRRTYTPLMIARLDGFQVVANFGNIGGRTDIALLYPIVEGRWGKWEEYPVRSDYTFHEVPRGTRVQEILLREPDLKRANDPRSETFGQPLKDRNRSSGCVNFDGDSWRVIKETLQGYLDEGKTVIVIFSVPGLDQDILVAGKTSWSFKEDPVSWWGARSWLYGETYDRRRYFTPAP